MDEAMQLDQYRKPDEAAGQEPTHAEPDEDQNQQCPVTRPALVTRSIEPAWGWPRYEIRPLDRNDAEMAPPLFVPAKPNLQDEIAIGDVVVLYGEGSRLEIIDIDYNFPRSGEAAIVVNVDPHSAYPYEIELEGDGYAHRCTDAILWERLAQDVDIEEGDRVKCQGGIIHGLARKNGHSRFIKHPPLDLGRPDLHGKVPNMALDMILTAADRKLNPEKYLSRSNRFDKGNYILFYGPPGVGKTFTVEVAFSILAARYNIDGEERIVFISAEGSSIEGALVGSGPKALREIRSLAQKAIRENKMPIIFLNEAGSLLRSRETQSRQLDGGSSLATHEQFLALTSGPDRLPGIVIVDLNLEKLLDEATRQRFFCMPFPFIERDVFVEQMFRKSYEKESSLFSEPWAQIRESLVQGLDCEIGNILIGSETVPVKVGQIIDGRMYEKAFSLCYLLLDRIRCKCNEDGSDPIIEQASGALMYYAVTWGAWSLFKCWTAEDARKRLVPEAVRPEKASSISMPQAHNWPEINMPEVYDCRALLDDYLVEEINK